MKRIFFLVIFLSCILKIYAQSDTNYNQRGDQAYQNNDFQTARTMYTIGLDTCDLHSINRLTQIWINQPSMRESMRLDMRNSFNCLKIKAESENSDAMELLIEFYNGGMGTEKDSIQANYWLKKWGKAKGLDVIYSQDTIYTTEAKIPRKSLLSNIFCSFLTYTYSPTMPFGLTAGIYFDKIGAYISGRTSYKSYNSEYECNNTGVPAIEVDNPPYEFNREGWYSRMITGGILFPLVKNKLFVSAGGGYGKRDYYREIISASEQSFETGNKSEWCFNTDASYKGLTLEIGGMYIWKKLIFTGGVNSIQFKDIDVYIGLGITF